MKLRVAMPMFKCEVFYSFEDGGFIAQSFEFEGLSAFGKTPEEALREFEIAMQAYREATNDD